MQSGQPRTIVFCWIALSLMAASVWLGGVRGAAGEDVFAGSEVLWKLSLGDHQYTVPRVDGDRIFIGVNDTNIQHPAVSSTGGGILMCLDRAHGTPLWQLPIPRYMPGIQPPYHFDQWTCGICSSPAVDGDRLYVVSPRGDILCLDREGQANGNAGPFLDEKAYMGIPAATDYRLAPTDGDIVWRFGMIEQLDVVPHDVCGSCPAVYGDYVYACTSNGVDDTHLHLPRPHAPSLIALDKRTGQLAATDGAISGDRILHGTWSSPVVATFGERTFVLYGGGDGVLRAYKPLETGSLPSSTGPTLDMAWQYDCCPADYRMRDGQPIPYSRWNKISSDGPSEIISTPTIWNGRVYVAIGQSPVHGAGQGALSCVDGATGALVWESRKVNRTITDAVISDGLVFMADYSGLLHCLDAETGEQYWEHDTIGGVWCQTPVVANGLVYISNEKNRMWVLRASREKTVVAQGRARSTPITPVLQDGILYFPTQHDLAAIRLTAQ